MPWLHLPRSSYDLFVNDFPYDFFRHRRRLYATTYEFKLLMITLRCIRQKAEAKPYRDLADIVRQLQGYRAVIVLSSIPNINRTMPIQ